MDTYTIQEISQKFDLPASTLRYYEDIGLLTDVERTENNQRVYNFGHVCQLLQADWNVDCQNSGIFFLESGYGKQH